MYQATDHPAALQKAGIHPKILIIGGGFGGLECARQLGNSAVDVTVIDRRNHNLFQPLLYQVATAALSPADISEPIRRTLGRFSNINVLLGEVTAIDTDAKTVTLADGETRGYDVLILSTGSEYNYFSHPEWQKWAPGLKTIHEARVIRQRLLLAFEHAEACDDRERKAALLTTVIIGGGPTGVEMAGAVSELGRFMIERDFRNLQKSDLSVILVEAGPRILAAFPEDLAVYAHKYLEGIGVEVRTGQMVSDVREDGVTVGDAHIPAGCVVWGAGIKPSPAARWLGMEGSGKIPIDDRLRVIGYPDIFALGDTASLADGQGVPLPALAQVAKQQGAYLGKALRKSPLLGPAGSAFKFHNRGNTAVVGRNAAIFDFGRYKLRGRLAWFLWALVHVYLLLNFEKRLLVSIQWLWRYVTRQRGARLIDETHVQEHPLDRISHRSNPFQGGP